MTSPASPGPRTTDTGRTLESWKEIAAFLGVSVRTAHRWKEHAGLPVHRDPAGHALANTAELEQWRRSQPGSQRLPYRLALLAGLTVAAAAAAAATAWWALGPRAPASVVIEGEIVRVIDARQRTSWTVTIPGLGFSDEWGWQVSAPDRFLVADIDLDGNAEVLVNLLTDSATDIPGRLICYTAAGAVRWDVPLGRAVSDTHGSYNQNFQCHIVRPLRIGGRPYLLTVASHRRWHPCQVALRDPRTGAVVEEFWHPGALTHAVVADFDGDGHDELVLAGLNNPGRGHGSPVTMVLRLPFSRQPAAPGSLMAGLSAGGPVAYAALPRPDVLEAEGGVAAVKTLQVDRAGSLLARVRYTKDSTANLTYRLDAGLRVREVFTTIDLAFVHDRLWRTGALDHAFSPAEQIWLETLRHYGAIPDGNADGIRPYAR